MLNRLRRIPPYLVAAAALTAVFALATRKFLAGQAFPIWDAERIFGPSYMLIADLARQGRLLWWNPWSNGGEPAFMDIQYGAHSPVVLLLAWVLGPSVRGFLAYWLVLWLLFGLGVLALARHLRVPAWGGFVVAAGLTFSGFFVGHAEHTPVLFSWVWLPLVLYRLDVALVRGRASAALQAGLLFGLSAPGGYPAILFTNGVFLAFWIVLRVLCRDLGGPDEGQARVTPRTALRMAAILFGVTALVALPAFYSFFHEGKGYTNRVGAIPRELAVHSNALHPRALLTFASPYLATLWPRELWKLTDPSSCSLYAGGLLFIFALYGLVGRPRSGLRWALWGGALFAVVAALAYDLPVRGWLYDLVPPTRYFRHPSWFRAYTIFFLGLLALLGVRDLARVKDDRRAWWLLVGAAVLAVGLAALAYGAGLARAHASVRGAGHLHFLLAWAAPALLLPWLRWPALWRRGWIVAALLGTLAAADAVLAAGLANTLGLEGAGPQKAWADLDRRHRAATDLLKLDGSKRTLRPAGSYNNNNFYTREAALHSTSGLTNSYLELWTREPLLVAAATSADRFWFSSDPVRTPPTDAAFVALVNRAQALGGLPFVLHPRGTMTAPQPVSTEDELRRLGQAPAAERAAVKLERYLPDALTLSYEAPRDGWLLVTDRWAQGWTAQVNGAAVEVAGADFLFRAVPVRAGSNRVTMAYRPPGYPWLPPVSWLVVLAVLAVSVWPASWWPRRRRAAAAMPGPG